MRGVSQSDRAKHQLSPCLNLYEIDRPVLYTPTPPRGQITNIDRQTSFSENQKTRKPKSQKPKSLILTTIQGKTHLAIWFYR
jgi:hypothetical protein